ncbi:MAG TPA: beta-galactosidase trimerization domain-containing protein [Bryobacteraceae bacterium]
MVLSFASYAQESKPRPEWLGNEPLITVGNWDSMPIFRRRAGGQAVDVEADYAKQHTEEAVIKLKELGVTMAIIHFYKGFGLKAEASQLEDSRKLAALLKKHGIRVGVYVGSTLGYETFLVEKPEAAQWTVPDYLGKPLLYSNQSFRKRVYFMHPGYREYIKGVLRIALEELHADLIHFDNTSLQAQAPIFRHPLATQDFRDYLEHKMTPEQRTLRFGYPDVQYMESPVIDRTLDTIDDPLFQEWTDFRCHQLTAYYAEMEKFIRGINPHAAVECNPHSGISGRNTAWEQGVDYPSLLSHMDIVWTEEGNQAQVTRAGILVSKIRTYKMAETLGNRIFTYTGGSHGGKLQMAEAMAFNRQTLGQIGDGLAGYQFPADQKAYVSFFRDHFDLFRGVRSRPDVAVLHSYASMAFNNDLPWQSSMLVEQALIEAKIPFDIIFDPQLADLSRYKALILPDQESLDDAQMDRIRRYVESGGGLVATEQSSLYDNWRRRRTNYGLHDVFGVNAPAYRENLYTFRPYPSTVPAPTAEHLPPTPPASPANHHTFGRGRSSYLAAIRPAVPKPAGASMTSDYWKLPLNAQQIVDEVRWAAGGVSLEVKGPSTLVVEPEEQPSTGRVIVHMVNYDDEAHSSIDNVQISMKLPSAKKVQLLSPDSAAPVAAAVTLSKGGITFTVPHIRTYEIAVVEP